MHLRVCRHTRVLFSLGKFCWQAWSCGQIRLHKRKCPCCIKELVAVFISEALAWNLDWSDCQITQSELKQENSGVMSNSSASTTSPWDHILRNNYDMILHKQLLKSKSLVHTVVLQNAAKKKPAFLKSYSFHNLIPSCFVCCWCLWFDLPWTHTLPCTTHQDKRKVIHFQIYGLLQGHTPMPISSARMPPLITLFSCTHERESRYKVHIQQRCMERMIRQPVGDHINLICSKRVNVLLWISTGDPHMKLTQMKHGSYWWLILLFEYNSTINLFLSWLDLCM